MLTYKHFSIAAILAAIVCLGAVRSSEGIEIITMEPAYGDYESDHYHTTYVKTDEPYYCIKWYINNVYDGASYAPSSSAYFETYYLPNLSGSLKGTKYTIKAVAYWRENPDENVSPARSYPFRLFEPKTDADTRRGVHGRAQLSRHYYDGSAINVVCSLWAHNPTALARDVFSRFRHTVNDFPPDERDDRDVLNANGNTYQRSDTLPFFPHGPGEYNSDAYIRLIVSDNREAHWFVENLETFNIP